MERGFPRVQVILLLAALLALLGAIFLRFFFLTPEPPIATDEPATLLPSRTPEPATPQPIDSEPAAPAHFVEGAVGEVRKINPLLAGTNPVDQALVALIFEGLAASNDYGEAVPALAERWVVSRDGRAYTVYLREDAVWHDGEPVTSADVLYTFDTLASSDFTGPSKLRAFWKTVYVEALGDFAVRFRLAQPLASFPDYLRTGLLPAHILGDVPVRALSTHPFNLDPIGTGPYMLESLNMAGEAIAQVNVRRAPTHPHYALECFTLRLFDSYEAAFGALEAGEIHALGDLPPDFYERAADNPALNLYTAVAPRLGLVLFNWQQEHFQDQRVRLALAHSLDRGAILSGYDDRVILANSPFLPGSWAWGAVRWPSYDPERAARLIEVSQAKTIPAFTLICRDAEMQRAFASAIVAQWAALSVTVQVEALPDEAFESRLAAGEFDAALAELDLSGFADPDPYPYWGEAAIDGGLNYAAVAEPVLSELAERGRAAVEGAHRASYYDQFQDAFAGRVPAILLYNPVFGYVFREEVSGVQLGFLSAPADRFRSIQNWRIGQ